MPVSRLKRSAAAALLAALVAAAAPACARQAPGVPVPLPPPEEPLLRGVSEVAFVPDPTVPPLELPPDEEIVRPSPRMIPAPLYPDDALEAQCGDAVIGLRIIVGGEGHVIEVQDSPVLDSTSGSCGRRFRDEAARAVRNWIFIPALWRKLEPGEDLDGDGKVDYRKVVASRRIPVYLDVRIDFEVIGGEGRVKMTI